jgi:hypothetical protein
LWGCGSDSPSISSASSCDELAEAAEGPFQDQLDDAIDLLNEYDVDTREEIDPDDVEGFDEKFDAVGEEFNDELDTKAEELECESSFLDEVGCSAAKDVEGDAETGIAKDFVSTIETLAC